MLIATTALFYTSAYSIIAISISGFETSLYQLLLSSIPLIKPQRLKNKEKLAFSLNPTPWLCQHTVGPASVA